MGRLIFCTPQQVHSRQRPGILLEQCPSLLTERLLPLLVVAGPGYSSAEPYRISAVEGETELLQLSFDALVQLDEVLALLHRRSIEVSGKHFLGPRGKRLPGTAVDQSELTVPHVVDRNIFLNLVKLGD